MFSVVLVCTGNICRSPLAEAAFKRATDPGRVSVSSVGLVDLGQASPPPDAIRSAESVGLDIRSHVSRPVTDIDLSTQDLVLGFEVRHVAAAVVEAGARAEVAFKVLELARLLRALSEDKKKGADAREIVLECHRDRQTSAFFPGEEVIDPFRRPLEVHLSTARVIASAVEEICRGLFGAATSSASS